MNELFQFMQAFGPVFGLILYILQKQIVAMIARKEDAELAARLTGIEESLKRLEDQLKPPTPPPINEGSDANQPTK